MNDLTKNILVWVGVALVLLVMFSHFMPGASEPEQVTYSTFLGDVQQGRIDSVVLQGELIYGTRKDKSKFQVYNPETNYTALIGELTKANVGIEGKAPKARDFTNQRTRRGGIVDEAVRAKNRNKSRIRSRVEHVFGVVKRLWGFGKVRYRGLQKNATRAFTALALANIYLGRQRLMAQVRP